MAALIFAALTSRRFCNCICSAAISCSSNSSSSFSTCTSTVCCTLLSSPLPFGGEGCALPTSELAKSDFLPAPVALLVSTVGTVLGKMAAWPRFLPPRRRFVSVLLMRALRNRKICLTRSSGALCALASLLLSGLTFAFALAARDSNDCALHASFLARCLRNRLDALRLTSTLVLLK